LVPVHDLVFRDGDIVLATHGRSFYIMDDISTLEQMSDAVRASDAHLFKPRDQYRLAGGGFGGGRGFRGGAASQQVTPENAPIHPVGQNPPGGVVIQYWVKSAHPVVTLDILDAAGKVVRSYTSNQDSATAADSVKRAVAMKSKRDSLQAAGLSADSIRALMRTAPDAAGGIAPSEEEEFRRTPPPPRAPNKTGVNTFAWNMRYADAASFPGMVLWAAGTTGPLVPPGTYRVQLTVNGKPVGTESFRLMLDPRIKATVADWQEQSRFSLQIRNRFSQANEAVKTIRDVKAALKDREGKLTGAPQTQFSALSAALSRALSTVEDSLYQTQNRTSEDPLNFPIRLNNEIGALMGVVASADGRPTQQSYEVFRILSARLDGYIGQLNTLLNRELPKANAILKASGQKEIEATVPK
ncbi:MAG TPA: hypothetical protein VF159_08180, partial [Gemmatimonadaceae bacterium]